MQPRYHVIDQWRTPASAYPRATVGEWSITTRRQAPGLHKMQEYGSFYYHAEPIELTVLREGEKVWFTDEPRQIYALAEIGIFRARGNVIVGGLGLGLIHHFLRLNPDVDCILTIERAKQLETLTWPYIQHGELLIGDFYELLPALSLDGYKADTIITDFIFGYQNDETWAELQTQREFCKRHYPEALFLEHGYQRRIDAEVVEAIIFPAEGFPPGVMYDQVQIVR